MSSRKKRIYRRKRIRIYRRIWSGIPTLLAAASWPAIWLLWPAMTPLVSSRQSSATHLVMTAPSEWILAEPATVFASPW